MHEGHTDGIAQLHVQLACRKEAKVGKRGVGLRCGLGTRLLRVGPGFSGVRARVSGCTRGAPPSSSNESGKPWSRAHSRSVKKRGASICPPAAAAAAAAASPVAAPAAPATPAASAASAAPSPASSSPSSASASASSASASAAATSAAPAAPAALGVPVSAASKWAELRLALGWLPAAAAAVGFPATSGTNSERRE